MSCHTFCDEAGFSLDEIRAASAAGKLLTMEIEFSQLCNFSCPYCYLDTRPQEELTSEECRDLILQGRDLGVRKIIILGGEPMIYPRILEKINFIRSRGMDVEIFTNGSNMTVENARELAELDVKVVLKMNTLDPDLQNRMCGINDAHRIIYDAFTHLKQAGYGPGGKPMAVSSVICSENIGELPSMWRWLRSQRIDPYFEIITPQGSAVENGWLSVPPDRVEELFRELAEIDRREFGREWSVQPPLVGDICLRHQFSCYVNAYGDVMPCVGITIPVGNIRQNRLADILRDSEVVQDLRNYRNTIKGPCAACDKSESCYGCRGAAYQMTGDYLASDPLCWKNCDLQWQIDRLPMPVDELIPHRPPLKMVDTLLSVGERCAEVETRVGEDHLFLNADQTLDPVACVEIMAQAAAAHNGFRRRHLDEKPEGLLLGVRNLTVSGTVLAGDRLCTRLYKEARLGDFGIISAEIFKGGERIARGEIKVFQKGAGEAA